MQIEKLDHVNLRTRHLDDMIGWYEAVLGLTKGPRPNFGFPGAWMYAGDQAVVHLVAIEEAEGTGSETALKLEHFAFTASGSSTFEARLKERGTDYRKVDVVDTGMVAFNIWDPDGNHIHVDFKGAD
jgi:catechol-2,3-dioxygenase